MTPSQLEHLKLIDAHLERMLANAEKRAAGWKITKDAIALCIANLHTILNFRATTQTGFATMTGEVVAPAHTPKSWPIRSWLIFRSHLFPNHEHPYHHQPAATRSQNL